MASASTSPDVDLLAEGPSDWESPKAAADWRDAIEEQYLDLAEPVLNDFLSRVRTLAEEKGAADGKGFCVELCGVCTDICVVSNALLLKAALPEADFIVNGALCAGVTPQKHEAALETMRSCQIEVR